MLPLTVALEAKDCCREIRIDETGTLRTASLRYRETELLQEGGDEFIFAGRLNESMRLFRSEHFRYVSHERIAQSDMDKWIFRLELKPQAEQQFVPFGPQSWDLPGGGLHIELTYAAYHDVPVIRKWLAIRSQYPSPFRLEYMTWEDIKLIPGDGRQVYHRFFTAASAWAEDTMDESAMAAFWPERGVGVIVATEAPGAMKRLELFKDGDRARVSYNFDEETVFEWALREGETFETDASFLLPFGGSVQDAVDGPFRAFVAGKLAIVKAADVPTFTVNTWETFQIEITESIVLDNIAVAAELGIDAYQLDFGWHVDHGDYRPHPVKFPNGLEPIVDACRKHGMKLGLWMSVPNVHLESEVARLHPEWIQRDENGGRSHMIGWTDTAIMCLQSSYSDWIIEQIDAVVKRYGVSLLKLDLASVRDPYNPGKMIGCHARDHDHETVKSTHLGLYRSMFRIMDEVRRRNPDCLIDLSFELYGVLHGTDLAHIQHAHQNWITNQDTAWLEPFRRLIHTRSRIVPSYTLNFGACHLTDPLAKTYGFWSVLLAHGLYYGDLRKLSEEDKQYYRHWFDWVKAYRQRCDFYAWFKVSDALRAPDCPEHADRRFHPYVTVGGRIHTQSAIWDGAAKLSPEGEGLVLLFRPEACGDEEETVRFPWMDADGAYRLYDVLGDTQIGQYRGEELREGIRLRIAEAPGTLVVDCRRA
ncbi:glycoside hydrolase family 36 protein [Paenibacillus nasutitermitis]|uniref:Alpha-galactosidase n=1 Tax=Paenibacillus nasutitermitis TaxID=1652958 RepID=A0A916ZCX3_9BACL|nr:glycoside hydrolase family 36 protein [Paenibacillus nasutitermitis]GGD88907.1 hypothetical protein GCM10010911_54360 [Paenibacillus nasutitermitis]